MHLCVGSFRGNTYGSSTSFLSKKQYNFEFDWLNRFTLLFRRFRRPLYKFPLHFSNRRFVRRREQRAVGGGEGVRGGQEAYMSAVEWVSVC